MRILTDDLNYQREHARQMRYLEEHLRTETGREALRQDPQHHELLALFESIQADGMRNPIIVRTHVHVGNQRLACARALGLEEIEVVFAGADESINTLVRTYRPMAYDRQGDRWVCA